ncbi:RtcB family protein [Saltatorellus ferox]|uniref:RtcB family protein n=1 Tax=Saltatorellus ferox TaxID=2528018 RepID=UPI003AF3F9A6
MPQVAYETIETAKGVPIKAWTLGVGIEEGARRQLIQTSQLPIIHGHLAVMPDVHWGMGATIGSVIPTLGAIVPAAVGVDIGCGMCAARTSLMASDLPDDLKPMRLAIEAAIPHGRTTRGRDKGSWHDVPKRVGNLWKAHLEKGFGALTDRYKSLKNTNNLNHLGTLGGGNHFVEVCLDEEDRVWFMLHSGSRGVGNRIASVFIEKARKDMEAAGAHVPHRDLSYLTEGTEHFEDYVEALLWAQEFARLNRQVMMENLIEAVTKLPGIKPFRADATVVNCHHNYVAKEHHMGKDVWLTRKGAVRAGLGDMGIIPGSMGAKSFIVRGKGNPEAFDSCSHGAGRVMSRSAAKRQFTVDDQIEATKHVECRKDASVIDEIPMAYKDIEKVMEAQKSLVDIVHTLRQVVCVKG